MTVKLAPHAPGECPACTGYDVSVGAEAITDGHGYMRGRIVASIVDAVNASEDWLPVHPHVRVGEVVVTRLGIVNAVWSVAALRRMES